MTTKFDIHLIVPAKLVGTIVEIVEGEGILVAMSPYDENNTTPTPESTKKKKKFRYVDGLRVKDIKGVDLILQLIRSKPVGSTLSSSEVERIFKEHRFAAKSGSVQLHTACRKGYLRGAGLGKYEILKHK